VCGGEEYTLSIEFGAPALICDKVAALTPTTAFVTECNLNTEKKENNVLVPFYENDFDLTGPLKGS